MTTIIFKKGSDHSYSGFICMGHAGYVKNRLFGRKRPDILCSAISALVISTINSLEELAGEKICVTSNEETGFLKCDFTGTLQEKSVFLMDSLVFSLENLSKEYGEKYLQVKSEEV